MSLLGPVQTHQQFYQCRFTAAAGTNKSNGFATPGGKADVLQGILRSCVMFKVNAVVLQCINRAKVNRSVWFWLWFFLHQHMKIIEAGFCFAVGNNDVTNFLQRAKNEEAVEGQCQYFTG